MSEDETEAWIEAAAAGESLSREIDPTVSNGRPPMHYMVSATDLEDVLGGLHSPAMKCRHCDTLRTILEPFQQHPDYRQEWKP